MEKILDSPPKQNITIQPLISPTPTPKAPQSRLTPKIKKQPPAFSLDTEENVEGTCDGTQQTEDTKGDGEDDDDDDSTAKPEDKGGGILDETWLDNEEKKKSSDRLIELFKSIEEEAREEARTLDDLEMEIASTSDEITSVNDDIKKLQTHNHQLKAEIAKIEQQLKVTAPSSFTRLYMSKASCTDTLLILGVAAIVLCFAVALMRIQELKATSQIGSLEQVIGQVPV